MRLSSTIVRTIATAAVVLCAYPAALLAHTGVELLLGDALLLRELQYGEGRRAILVNLGSAWAQSLGWALAFLVGLVLLRPVLREAYGPTVLMITATLWLLAVLSGLPIPGMLVWLLAAVAALYAGACRLRMAVIALAVAAAALLPCPPVSAQTRAVIIGGGYDAEHSQAQIEANVRWVEEFLLGRGLPVETYFGAGTEPTPDVAFLAPAGDGAAGEPAPLLSGPKIEYRPHQLHAVRGSTSKAELAAELEREFGELGGGDELLLVYNGHGGIVRSDTRRNYLKLWGDERMSVADFAALLDRVPPETPTRFVFAQCYSGAFADLVYGDPMRRKDFRGNRCGFMSESAQRLAEGCKLAVDHADFRDYTTYFFAALRGVSRSGEPLPPDVLDRDHDGAVSFREAHFHALVAAKSADLPRSTSEQFLRDWSPWYLRWDSVRDRSNSVYWSLANEVAGRYGWRPVPAVLEPLRQQFAAERAQLDAQRRSALEDAARLRSELRTEADAAAGLETPRGTPAASTAALERIGRDPRYLELERAADRARGAAHDSLELTRTLTQIDKIYRLRQLARLEDALQRSGDAAAWGRYSQLLQCENGTLQGPPERSTPASLAPE